MKKIAIVSFHTTGSSLVGDLLRECDNVAYGRSNAEMRVLHDPDGISDLEYHIVKNPHRLGTALAIRRFIAYCEHNRNGKKLFGKEWILKSREYADSLKKLRYKGWIYNEVPFFPIWERIYLKSRKALNILAPKYLRRQACYNYLPFQSSFFSILTEDEFLEKTRRFVNWMCDALNPEKKEYLVLDQFASSHNPQNECRYVSDMKVIVVDRDPRDIYINSIKFLNEGVLATNPNSFAVQYRLLRRSVKDYDAQTTLYVHFEDFLFHYDEAVRRVFDFLGINPDIHHTWKKQRFNPAVSVNGVQMWKKYPQYDEEIKVLEENLKDMLYDYPDNTVEIREMLQAGFDKKKLQSIFKHLDDSK